MSEPQQPPEHSIGAAPPPAPGPTGEAASGAAPAAAPPAAAAAEETALVDIETFRKLDLRVAEIVLAERIPKADRLLRLVIDLGSERRQLVAGIAAFYAPEQLVGRKIIVVANREPAKLRGVESQGMLLAAGGRAPGEPLGLLSVDAVIPNGTRVS